MVNTVKVTAEEWIAVARAALISNGVNGIKVDRLARQLGVTRGGFYHHFNSRDDLLQRLLSSWSNQDVFFHTTETPQTPAAALATIKALMAYLIAETEFSPALDAAVRDWARTDKSVKLIVDRVDKKRLKRLKTIFEALGCDDSEATIRARVVYFHQLGYYSLGLHEKETKSERMGNTGVYLDILCGAKFVEAAEGIV